MESGAVGFLLKDAPADTSAFAKLAPTLSKADGSQWTLVFDETDPRVLAAWLGGFKGKVVALWGLAFKPNTDDMREAPSRALVAALAASGAKVRAWDPVAVDEARKVMAHEPALSFAASPAGALEGADALVVVTEWQEFRSPDFDAIRKALREPLVFDGRNLYDPATVRAAGSSA